VTSRSEIETTPFEELCSQACAESKVLNPGCFDILKVPAIEKLYKIATLNNEIRELNQYRSTIDISGFAPEPVFFINDKTENCEAATALGMQAIHFESPVQRRSALAQFGIQAA
jgi:hypothetical protein